MASYPWIVPHERQRQNLDDFPNLKRWFDAIAARPATQRAYAAGKNLAPRHAITSEEGRRVLFGLGTAK